MVKFDYSVYLESLEIIQSVMDGKEEMLSELGLVKKIKIINLKVDFHFG